MPIVIYVNNIRVGRDIMSPAYHTLFTQFFVKQGDIVSIERGGNFSYRILQFYGLPQ